MGGSLEAFRIYLDTFKVRDEVREVKESTYSSFYEEQTTSTGPATAKKSPEEKAVATMKGDESKEEDSGYESNDKVQ